MNNSTKTYTILVFPNAAAAVTVIGQMISMPVDDALAWYKK